MVVRRAAVVGATLLACAAAQRTDSPAEQIAIGASACVIDCGGAGRCDAEAGQCICDAGYTGAACEFDIDDCRFNPCFHGGVCVDGVNSFTCSCPVGYFGMACQLDSDECASAPCLNGGACVDSQLNRRIAGDQYWCECADGFAGEECEVRVNACAERPCARGGHCVNEKRGGGFTCACPFGWAGDTCEVLAWQLPFISGAGLIIVVFIIFDFFESLWGRVERGAKLLTFRSLFITFASGCPSLGSFSLLEQLMREPPTMARLSLSWSFAARAGSGA